jgi:hypothetical protein
VVKAGLAGEHEAVGYTSRTPSTWLRIFAALAESNVYIVDAAIDEKTPA